MPKTQYDSPFIKWDGQGKTVLARRAKQAEQAKAKHDGLCVIQSGLSSCWCRCTKCWDKYARYCICFDCTCRRP